MNNIELPTFTYAGAQKPSGYSRRQHAVAMTASLLTGIALAVMFVAQL